MPPDDQPPKKLAVKEIAGPHRSATAEMTTPVQVGVLLQDVLRETKETRDTIVKVEAETSATRSTIAKVDAKVETLGRSVVLIGTDVSRLKSESEERARRHSGSISKISSSDLQQDAAIASTLVKVASVESKVDALATDLSANSAMTAKVLDKVVDKASGYLKANPTLDKALVGLITVVLFLLTAWLSSLMTRGH